MLDIPDEYKKLQSDFAELRDVALSLVDVPGGYQTEFALPTQGQVSFPSCAGLFTANDDDSCTIEICRNVPAVHQVLIMLHESKHAIQFKSSLYLDDEGMAENDADRFMLEQFVIRYDHLFPSSDVVKTVDQHKWHQIGSAASRDFSYDTSIVHNFLASRTTV